jgi:hypothetical protein
LLRPDERAEEERGEDCDAAWAGKRQAEHSFLGY